MILGLLLPACEPEKTYTSHDRDDSVLTVEPFQAFTGTSLGDAAGGAVIQPFPGPGIGVGDLDGDGWLDVVFAAGTPHLVFLHNDGAGTLVPEPTWTVDGAAPPSANSVAVADVDGDDDLDLYLGTTAGDRLLTNDGLGRFTSIVLSDGATTSTTGSFGDFDRDGDLDLFVSRHDWPLDLTAIRAGAEPADPCTLYMDVDGAWVEDPDRIPFEARKLYSHQAVPFDGDGDGDLDVLVLSDWGNMNGPNAWLENDGYGRFTLVENGLSVEMGARGAGVGDLVTDGLPDAFVTDVGSPTLFVSTGPGAYEDGTADHRAVVFPGPDRRTSWGATTVDVDGDSLLDVAAVYGKIFIDPGFGDEDVFLDLLGEDPEAQRDLLLLDDGHERFLDVSDATGFAQTAIGKSVVVGDLDRDGRPDLLTAGFLDLSLEPYLQVWRTGGGWGPGVTLTFTGQTPIGARVDVTADSEDHVRWLLPASSYSSSAPEVYLGTRDQDLATSVVVTWPDGTVTDLGEVPVGSVTRVER